MKRASKVVLCTSGSYGDLHPFIAVGLAMQRRGWSVTVAAPSEYEGKIRSEGLGFHAVGPDYASVASDLGLDVETLWKKTLRPGSGLEFLLRKLYMRYLRRSYEDLLPATEGADLIVTHFTAFAARLLAEKKRIPWISAVLQPSGFMSAYDPPVLPMGPFEKLRPLLGEKLYGAAVAPFARGLTALWTAPVHEMRAELGLPNSGANPVFEGQFSPYGSIALYSPEFGAVQPDFPARTTITGFPFYDSEKGGCCALSPELERFLAAGPPPIVFSLGTAVTAAAGDFYEQSFEAAKALRARAVFLTGVEGRDPFGGALPPTMFACRYAPHSQLFARSEAVVHQGGIGTTAQALRAGRPQMIVPFIADQPDNAARIVRLGAGRTISRDAYTGRRAAAELSALLDDPAYSARCAELGRLIAREDGAARAAEVIDRMFVPA
jgi:UDP:flavonoid glycosyltransferase YjiC (YdhE family)